MGIEEKLPSGFLLSTVEDLAGYMRKSSLWPATFGLACCAIEMMATGAGRYDLARFGMEVFRASPRQADLMIVAGRVSNKMAPVLRQIYDQMPNPKWVLSMGVCASSGGMFNNYAIVQGVDHVVPVDIYLPGCPPRPEMLMDAILKLHDQIQHTKLGAHAGRRAARERDRRAGRRADVRDEGAAAMTGGPAGPAAPAARVRPTRPRRTDQQVDTPGAAAAKDASANPVETPATDQPENLPNLPEAEASTVAVRHGMFGIHGSGDTSGYSGLVRKVQLPAGHRAALRRLVRPGRRHARARDPGRRPPVLRRGRVRRRRPGRAHLPRPPRAAARRGAGAARRPRAALRAVFRRLRRALPGADRPRVARGLPPALDHAQPPDPARGLRARRRPAPAVAVQRLPDARLARARDLRLLRHHLRRAPGPDAYQMPDDWPGHPQRKDYPLGGIPVEYKGAQIAPPDERRSYS